MTDRMAFLARAVVPWRRMVAAALLALMLGAALSQGLTGERASVLAAARPGVSPGKRLSSLPLAAQGPISGALGADSPAYRVSASGAAFQATNPAQHLSARFERSGVKLSAGATHLTFGLHALGYGSSLSAVGDVKPSAKGNRIIYSRAGLSEWYLNGPLGLEQGFTIPRAPSTRAAGPLTLAMALSGNARASMAAGAQSVTISHAATSLRYGGLAASDASGRALHSWLELHGATLLLRVDARGGRYPLRIDPLVQQGSKLKGGGEEEGPGNFGASVALSADGNTALIGAPSDEDKGKAEMLVGAAWVFTRSGSTWSQQGPKLRGGGRQGEGQFGISVALSSDGNTALIGGINDGIGPVGAAWVFTRATGTWTQQGPKLTGGGEETGSGRFGRSVALSADGNTALVGAYFDNTNRGAAWVFTRSASTWTQQGPKLTGGKEEAGEAQFGLSVALSSDGTTALIGGPADEGGTKVPMAGAAWVFTRSGGTWTQQGAKLTGGAEESAAGELGTSVALSDDGNTALAGAPGDGGDGAAWAFSRSGSSWSKQGPKLAPSDATGAAGFGAGVALSGDGNTALVGGPVDKDSVVPTGAAWEFARAGSTWSQQGSKLLGAGEVPESEFGAGVALSADGDTALLGGPIDDTDIGAAWAFANPPPSVTTGAASGVGLTTATLNGAVNAGASNTTFFQYGTTAVYGAATAGQGLGAAGSARSLAAAVGGLSPGTTYHFRIVAQNSAGTSFGADQTFTTAVLLAIQAATPPVIVNASQSHRTWREGKRLASISRKRKLPPLGTTFSFTLNERAGVTFAFTQQVGGRKVNGRCVAQSKKNRRRRACKRTLTRGTLSFAGHAGRNKVSFQGVLSHSKKLTPGGYTLVITATTAGLRSRPVSLRFTIVK